LGLGDQKGHRTVLRAGKKKGDKKKWEQANPKSKKGVPSTKYRGVFVRKGNQREGEHGYNKKRKRNGWARRDAVWLAQIYNG